jgi:hypothetical protein
MVRIAPSVIGIWYCFPVRLSVMERVSAISVLVVVVSRRELTGLGVMLGDRRSLDAIASG